MPSFRAFDESAVTTSWHETSHPVVPALPLIVREITVAVTC